MASSDFDASDLNLFVRKWVVQVEEVLADGERVTERPIKRVVVAAIVKNPYAGRWSDDLEELIEAGEVLGRVFTTRAQELLDGNLQAYGKGGIVGERGEIEHIAALLHPKFGQPTRDIAKGVSILPSVKKHGAQGASLDIPIHHKDAMMIRSHFDAIEFRVGDSPRSDEILVALAASNGPRPHHRVGGLSAEDAAGVDGLR
ncbi:amino acid synthesis family protein [Glaciihabitans sp. UYNi722]|uniref:amino acid synthesis family protein n=1 Tax=Glaciihabitans sp. UYNi722 TaxID=3156344 RepID=UPI0033987601